MTKYSKVFLSFLAAGTLTVSLAGCGKGNGSSDVSGPVGGETSVSASSSQGSGLVVWGGVEGKSGPDSIVADWNAAHPEAPAEYVRYVNDDTGNTKLDTALLSGEQIDVFFSYADDLTKKRVESGMAANLSEMGIEAFYGENIIGGVDGALRFDDKIYTVSTVNEPQAILINQTLADELGVDIPDNWTVDEFISVAKQLTHQKDGKQVYGAILYNAGDLPLDVAKATNGADYFYRSDTESAFDDPVFRVNSKWKAMMDEGAAIPYQEVFTRKLTTAAHPAFLSGEVAMMPGAAWVLRYVNDKENFPHDFKVSFRPMPNLDDSTPSPYQTIMGNNMCINAKSNNKEGALEFIQHWVTEGYRHIGKLPAYVSADRAVVNQVIMGGEADFMYDVASFEKVMYNDQLKFLLPTKTTALPQISQIYKEETQNFLLGETSEETYYTNLKQRADEAISKESK